MKVDTCACCSGPWSVLCFLDQANHARLNGRFRRLCDWHEAHITGGQYT